MTATDLHTIQHRMTVAEAVAYSRKGDKTIRQALAEGALHGRQFTAPGGRWTIRRDCLEAWLDGERCPHGKGASGGHVMRGKHGASAETRRKIQGTEAEVVTYQHAVKRLTAENKSLRARLSEQAKGHSHELRVLKAQRDEGLSPTLTVLQAENASYRERTDRAERALKDIRRRWDHAVNGLLDHFSFVHGLTGTEAAEALLHLLPDSHGSERLLSESIAPASRRRLGGEAAMRIARARGERR